MIAYLKGSLGDTMGRSCIVITGAGVGYELSLPAHSIANLPAKGHDVAFYTYLAVREDALELFGFDTFEERQTFAILTKISKIGSRTALAILSAFRPAQLREAVLQDDISSLIKVPGIGQKTAQHILLELKYKLQATNAGQIGEPVQPKGSTFLDALAALINLGYTEGECVPYIRGFLTEEPDLDVGSVIRMTLKSLAKGKA